MCGGCAWLWQGPAQPIAIGGEPVVGLLPVFPNLIPQVLCVSYRSLMWMSLTVDPDAVKEPERLAALYLAELRALAQQHGQYNPNLSMGTATEQANAAANAASHIPSPTPVRARRALSLFL